MQIEGLRTAYRTAFEEYSKKLDALQCLMSSAAPERERMETAQLDVEKARVAHNTARDRLARELVRPAVPADAGVDEQRVRETARLLWEISGRPEGTAERDWRQAEQLVHAAGSSAG